MRKLLFLLFCLVAQVSYAQKTDTMATKFFSESLSNGKAYEQLRFLCKNIGGRLAGSPQAAAAVEWARQTMLSYCFDTVYLQEVMVPHWLRGEKEVAFIKTSLLPSGNQPVPICALGGSVATPVNGITAKVIEVHSIDELKQLGKKAKGKIIFFNRPMNSTFYSTFHAYGTAADQRFIGPFEAEKLGALAVIVRSLTTNLDDLPHTGTTRKCGIPAAAISTNAAEELSNLLKNDPELEFYIKMNCYRLPDVRSYNVIGEIKGSEKPQEIILVGGHLDSWDLAEGAHDDGTGCVQSMEALRLFKTLGIKPRHTLRAVMFMNEEFGLSGGTAYAKIALDKKEKHLAAIETDAGGFTPLGFTIDTSAQVITKISEAANGFRQYGIFDLRTGGAGADVYSLKDQGAITMDLSPDSQRYFDYHHTSADVFENVNQRELQLGAASLAYMMYVLDRMDSPVSH
jgi:hypothetical protein